MKDYKLSEIRNVCRKQRPSGDNGSCGDCPMFDVCINQLDIKLPCEWDLIESDDEFDKKLEVLEILKRTPFHIYRLGLFDNYMLHLDTDHSIQITEEEVNLIRKVLEIIID